MITDRSIVSARADKPNGPGRRVARAIATASAAVALTLPSLAAWGLEGSRNTPMSGNPFEQTALPPVPHLNTMPWLTWDAVGTLKVDTLLAPLPDPWGLKLAPEERDKAKPAIS